jgi:cytochrome c556
MKIVSAFAAVVILALGTTVVSSQQDPDRRPKGDDEVQWAGLREASAKMVKGEAPFDLPTCSKGLCNF